MVSVSRNMVNSWVKAYRREQATGVELAYPSETLVRLFKGDYVTGNKLVLDGKSVIDVGFGNGNNMLLMHDLGMRVSGVEIDQDICDMASTRFAGIGLEFDLRVGANESIPFEDNSFDYLVSWNVLHYEGSEEGIESGILEYARVLKKGGRLFLSTTGPTHKILHNGETQGNHLYKIGRPDDFRKGQVHFFFDNENYLNYYFSLRFKELQFGRIEDHLFKEKLDWLLVTGIKV